MKNNLENAFKDKLSEFEAPYDPQAWEAVRGQLDAKATGGGSSSAWKWIAASAVVATIAVTSIMVLSPNETNPAEINSVTEEESAKNNTDKSKAESKDENISVNHANNEKNGIDHGATSVSDENLVEENNSKADQNKGDVNTQTNIPFDNNEATTPSSDDNGTDVPDDVQATTTPKKYKYVVGNVTSNEICYGEQITITNSGAKNDIVRFQLNDEIKEIKKANTFIIQPESSIVINFVNKDNKIIDSEFIKVNELPTPDFTYEANIFENGLPITICEAYGDYQNIKWKFDGKDEKDGKKVKYQFFEKGNHTVTLNVTDYNGCKSSKEKEVRIENQYNLMAVDAFKPNGSEPKTKAFMPFSLTQRDVRFTLTIIDPRDNGVVFTSKDASNPWTGIDERTGEMTDSETVFIWKVQIENSLPNERPVYAGTVVHN